LINLCILPCSAPITIYSLSLHDALPIYPHVLAQFHPEHQVRVVLGGEEQIGAERDALAGKVQVCLMYPGAGGELTALVELPVGGDHRLGAPPRVPAAMVIHPPVYLLFPLGMGGAITCTRIKSAVGGARV